MYLLIHLEICYEQFKHVRIISNGSCKLKALSWHGRAADETEKKNPLAHTITKLLIATVCTWSVKGGISRDVPPFTSLSLVFLYVHEYVSRALPRTVESKVTTPTRAESGIRDSACCTALRSPCSCQTSWHLSDTRAVVRHQGSCQTAGIYHPVAVTILSDRKVIQIRKHVSVQESPELVDFLSVRQTFVIVTADFMTFTFIALMCICQ
jgi:hypothetical protein